MLTNKKSPKTRRIKSIIGSKHKNTTKHISRKEDTVGKEISSVGEGVTSVVTEIFQQQIESSNCQIFMNKKDSVSSLKSHTGKTENLNDTLAEPVDFKEVIEVYIEKETVLNENCKKSKFDNINSEKLNKNNGNEILFTPSEEKFETEESLLVPVFDVDNSHENGNELDENVKDDSKSNKNNELSDYCEKTENSLQITIIGKSDQENMIQDTVDDVKEKLAIKTENKKIIPSDNAYINITEDNGLKNKCKLNVNEMAYTKTEIEIGDYSGSARDELKMSVNLGNQQIKISKNTKLSEVLSWTREEDKVILQAFQQENDPEQTFNKINQRLSNRTVEEVC